MQALIVQSLVKKRAVDSQSSGDGAITIPYDDAQIVDAGGTKLGLLTQITFSIFPNASTDTAQATMVFSMKITAQGFRSVQPFRPVVQVWDAKPGIIKSWNSSPFAINCTDGGASYTDQTVVARAVYDNLDGVGWTTLGYPNTIPMHRCP